MDLGEAIPEGFVETPFICSKCKKAVTGWKNVAYAADGKSVMCIDCYNTISEHKIIRQIRYMNLFCSGYLCQKNPEEAKHIVIVEGEEDKRLTSLGTWICNDCKKYEQDRKIKEAVMKYEQDRKTSKELP